MTFLTQANAAHAQNFNLESFSLFELANEQVELDGVSTKYGVGATGLSVVAALNPKLDFSISAGYGYHPSYTVSYLGTDLTGPIKGYVLQGGLRYQIISSSRVQLFINGNVNQSAYASDSLKGVRNDRPISSSADATNNATELYATLKFNVSSPIVPKFYFGAYDWSLNSLGVTYIGDAKVTKRAKGSHTDLMYGAGMDIPFMGSILSLNYKYKELSADNKVKIDSLNLQYKLNF